MLLIIIVLTGDHLYFFIHFFLIINRYYVVYIYNISLSQLGFNNYCVIEHDKHDVTEILTFIVQSRTYIHTNFNNRKRDIVRDGQIY